MYVETGLDVEEDGTAIGSDIDHGKFVSELGFVLQGRVKNEAPKTNESKSLRMKLALGERKLNEDSELYRPTCQIPRR